ncbi:hypothetical protein ACFFGH_26880 [Lysobacter korlensis]|uniref:Cell shape protein MreC n=1 Tax=Lysobacter korlensis TaxID=553636 RepID=A0ABV6RWW0_9GAMM
MLEGVLLRRFWRALVLFWVAVGSGAGLVASYLAAEAAKVVWLFWLIVAVAAVVALLFGIGPALLDGAQKLRTYPKLLLQVGTLKDRVAELEAENKDLNENLHTARAEGVREGENRILGAVKADGVEPPRLVGVAEYHGELILVGEAQDSSVPEGARFVVRSEYTGQVWGVVEALATQPGSARVPLTCVEPTVEKYWEGLAARVGEDDSAPKGAVLAPFTTDFSFETGPDFSAPQVIVQADTEGLDG